MRITLAAKILLILVLLICIGQFPRSIDFAGYAGVAGRAWLDGYHRIPYPVASAKIGDYFQAPVFAVLLAPWGLLPMFWAKLLWALMNVVGVVFFARHTMREGADWKVALFLLLLFTHPLSDVFLSGNMNFPMLVAILLGWENLRARATGRKIIGGQFIALAIYMKLIPALFLVWFALKKDGRAVLSILAGLATGFLLTAIFIPHETLAAWWTGWWHAVGMYDQAAYAGTIAYQSPPAAFFRLLTHAGIGYAPALRLTQTLAIAIMGGLFLVAFFEESLPVLLSLFFLGNTYAWALTMLFLFPLVYHYAVSRPSRFGWAAVIAYALVPKALWPLAVWNQMAEWSLPALLIAVVAALSFRARQSATASVAQSSSMPTVGTLQSSN